MKLGKLIVAQLVTKHPLITEPEALFLY